MVYQTARAEDETVEAVLGVQLLNLVEQTGDDVVTARSLTTAEDDTHVHLLRVGLGSGDELNEGHTVGVGEQLLDLFLVGYTLGGSTLLHFDSTLQSLRQLGLIGGSCNLQCTFFHNLYFVYNE